MFKFYASFLALVLCASITVSAQKKPLPLGNASTFVKSLREQAATGRSDGSTLQLRVAPGESLSAKLNVQQSSTAEELVIGSIANEPHSSFSIRLSGNTLDGTIVLTDKKKAYRYTSDASGNAFVNEVDINSVVCIEYEKDKNSPVITGRTQAAAISPALLTLESYPGANGVVLLDFDGQYVSGTLWNGGNPINAAPSTMTDAQIQEIWEMVSEDYRPFHLNITTNEAVFNSYPQNRRMRVIFTPTNTAAPGAGGVAYINSFSWTNDTPCWVFNGGVKGGGEAASHEVGHTFGLGHDGRTSPVEDYYAGQGSWAPIMGVGYYVAISQWSKGEYANANNKEDDLAKIAGSNHGVGYRADDRGNTIATASALQIDASGSVSAAANFGVIDRTADVDMFSFTTSGGTVTLNINPATRHPDLDVLATLYNSAGTVITTANPTALSASISTSLAQGTYYLSVTGTGAGAANVTGYSNYASLGYYTISGTVPSTGTGTSPVTVYKDCSFSGAYAVALPVGNYTTAQLVARGIQNKDISSFRVQSGYELVLYKGDNFAGTYSGFTGDVSCLTQYTLNDSTSSLRVRSVSNQLPTVSLSSPVSGTVFNAPASISITAGAADADGGVAKVEFFNGTTKLGEDTSAPYSFTWSGVAAGTYTVRVTATDDRGGQASAQTSVTVGVTAAATVYRDCNYAGTAVALSVGDYTLSQLQAKGVINDDISSLKVASGYEVILYQNDNFGGSAYLFRGDFSCLVSLSVGGQTINLNDWTSSVVVRASTAAALAQASESAVRAEERVSLTVSPNPVQDQLTLNLEGASSGDVQILSLQGTAVGSVKRVAAGETVYVADLAPGVYLVKVSTDKGVVTQRIIKR